MIYRDVDGVMQIGAPSKRNALYRITACTPIPGKYRQARSKIEEDAIKGDKGHEMATEVALKLYPEAPIVVVEFLSVEE